MDGKDCAENSGDAPMFAYSFSVWPSETRGFRCALFDLFKMLNFAVEMNFTERDFDQFRLDLLYDGFTLREIERHPYVEPESVL